MTTTNNTPPLADRLLLSDDSPDVLAEAALMEAVRQAGPLTPEFLVSTALVEAVLALRDEVSLLRRGLMYGPGDAAEWAQ